MSFKKSLIEKAVSILMVVGMAFLIFSCQAGRMAVRSEKPLTGYSGAVADYEAGRYKNALETFNGILRDQPDHPEVQMIKYYQAFCYYHTGDFKKSVTLAAEWLKDYPDSPERYKVQKLAGDASRSSGLMYDACFWMFVSLRTAKDAGVSGHIQDMISDGINEVISQSSENDLKKIIKLDNINPFFPSIYLREAEIALEKGTYHRINSRSWSPEAMISCHALKRPLKKIREQTGRS